MFLLLARWDLIVLSPGIKAKASAGTTTRIANTVIKSVTQIENKMDIFIVNGIIMVVVNVVVTNFVMLSKETY